MSRPTQHICQRCQLSFFPNHRARAKEIGWITMGEAETLLKRSLDNDIKRGYIAGPKRHFPGGSRKYFDKLDIAKLREFYKSRPRQILCQQEERRKKYVSITELASMLGCSTFNAQYHIKKGRLDQPTHTFDGIGGFFWTKVEAKKQVRKYLAYKQKGQK